MTERDAFALLPVWCGSYTHPHGEGVGIARLVPDERGALAEFVAAAGVDSPSFLALHPSLPLLYAVSEFDQSVQAFRVGGGGALEPVGHAWAAGEAVCHVAVDPGGRFLVVACWGDGAVISFDLNESGAILARQVAEQATDPYPGDARVSRAHASLMLPDNRVLTTDLGFDLLRVWRFVDGGLALEGEVPLGAGCGPRHLALGPGGHVYVVTEYSIEVIVIRITPGLPEVIGRTPATIGGARDGDAAAEVSVSEQGKHVHVTVRGSNRVATLAVRDGGARLEPVADTDSGGLWPRHHLQRGPFLYVANQLSNVVTIFRLDPDSGVPTTFDSVVPTGSPTCLVPLRG